MNSAAVYSKITAKLFLGGLLLLSPFSTSFGGAARPPLATEKTRREISPERPAFMFHFDVWCDGKMGRDIEYNLQRLEDLHRTIPADVRNYFIINIMHGHDVPAPRDRVEALVRKCNDLGFYCTAFYGWFLSEDGPQIGKEFREYLIKTYPYFLGFIHTELAYSRDMQGPVYDDNVLTDLRLAEEYGGYLVWQIQGMRNVLPLMAEHKPEILRELAEHSDRFILMNRTNSIGENFSNVSEILGAWLTGLCNQWGHNGQNWNWWHPGFRDVFGVEQRADSLDKNLMIKCIFTYPESIMGLEWLEAASLGATLFDLEATDHSYVARDARELTPAFKYVILPLMRKMINNGIIPAKDYVKARMPVAYLRQRALDSLRGEVGGYGFRDKAVMFRHLYGPRYDDKKEWLPYTGRYWRLPVLTSIVPESEKEKFKYIFTEDTWPHGWDKVKWFNERFPAKGRGDAWFVPVKDRWFIANAYVNQDIKVDFEIPLKQNLNASSVSGVFAPHTFAILDENEHQIQIHLSNYRVDTTKDVWENRSLDNDLAPYGPNWAQYSLNKYCVDPTDDTPVVVRESVVSFHGLSKKPQLEAIDGGEEGFERPFEHRETWNADEGIYTLTTTHNGPVDIVLQTGGEPVARPGNLALFGVASASSVRSVYQAPDNAIDGNDRSSRWEAASDSSDPSDKSDWLQVDLREPKTVSRVVLKEYLDRVTDYRLEYLDGGEWSELARGTTIGVRREHEFPAVTAEKIRLRIIGSREDSIGKSKAPSLQAFEAYGEEPGLSAGYSPMATDTYEAEDDALSVGKVERVETAEFNKQLTQTSFGAGFMRVLSEELSGVEFPVKVPEDGMYRVGLRYSRGPWFGTGGGLINMYANGRFIKTVELTPLVAWGYWNVVEVPIELKSGVNIIGYRNEYGDFGVCMLDRLQVTRVADDKLILSGTSQKMPMPEVPALAKAPRYDLGQARFSGGARKDITVPGYYGTGYAQLGRQPGDSAAVTISVPQAGDYRVLARYSFPPYWVFEARSLSLYVDEQKIGVVDFPKPERNFIWGDGKWELLEIANINLPAGKHTLKFKVDDGCTGNVVIDTVLLVNLVNKARAK